MLTSIGISGFKSYRETSLKLAPLTVLIGANAAGKSNAIEALRLLSWIAQGNRLSSIRYAVYEGDQAVRGTVASLGYGASREFTLSCEIEGTEWNAFSITLNIGEDDDLHISREQITSPHTTVPLYEVVSHGLGAGSDLLVAYNNFARGGKKPRVTCNDHLAILHQLQGSARFEEGHKSAQSTIPEACRRIQDILSNVLFLDPQPSVMREYSFKTEHRLKGNGSNLSGVLYRLYSTDPGDKGQKILDLIRSLPEQNIAGMTFIETPRGEVMVALEETFGGEGRNFDATLLSDGTLRVLSIAAAILSAPEGSLVVIEEIDNGIHPSRAKTILNSISQIAKQRNLRVLISSHNPALLDALPDDAVPHVVFCYRQPDGSSKLVCLADIPDYPELVAQGSVGHLMTRGLIDRFVKTHSGPAARQQRARDWLDYMFMHPEGM
ncbi:MAG: AAA family ATPase [Alphaproteobacteria bacterium]|nr:AAA family ATPase [Alphaproteobacteria bacterium]